MTGLRAVVYAGDVYAKVTSCEQSGNGYNVVANFWFSCIGFLGAKSPTLKISSSSGGSVTINGEEYDNDPLVRQFFIPAEFGDTLSITLARWESPDDSGEQASLYGVTDFYKIQLPKMEPLGSAWGANAWGGVYFPEIGEKEEDIIGALSVLRTFSDDITGGIRVSKNTTKNITGVVRVGKVSAKSIAGAIRIVGLQEKSIVGAVYVHNQNETVSSTHVYGAVDVLNNNTASITGATHVIKGTEVSIEGHVKVEKPQTSSISGLLRVVGDKEANIVGRIRVRVATPGKLPTAWEYKDDYEAETWETEDKSPEEWEESSNPEANEWSMEEKEPEEWEQINDGTSSVWEYPLEESD